MAFFLKKTEISGNFETFNVTNRKNSCLLFVTKGKTRKLKLHITS